MALMNKNSLFLVAGILTLSASADFRNECMRFRELLLFPHQVAIADIICTGTVISNYSNGVSEFSAEEILWGSLPRSNICIRCGDDLDELSLKQNNRYLVFAFTNNWWFGMEKLGYDFIDASETFLSDFISSTNRPPDNIIFPDCRIMNSKQSAVNFSKFEIDGTNYWPGTRSFITNFLEITRIQNDNIKAFRKLKSYFYESPESTTIPPWLLRHFHLYYGFRYHGVEPERP